MLFGCFLGCNDTIAPCVEFCILNLQLWVGKKIFDTATNALIEANIGLEAWNGILQFGAVEFDAHSLVAKEIA